MTHTFTYEGETPERLDKAISGVLHDYSRSQVSAFIKAGSITLDGKRVKKAGTTVSAGSVISLHIVETDPNEDIQPNPDLDCTVLAETADGIIINKAPGILSHPTMSAASRRTSVVSWLIAYLGKSPETATLRPGIVHRLDQWTSGCMLLAKNMQAKARYSDAFEKRTVQKEYLALVEGIPVHAKGVIDAPIGRDIRRRVAMDIRAEGKHAKTSYTVLSTGTLEGESVSLLRLVLHTGRTHQIRVHLKAIGHPIVGDPTYGAHILPEALEGQLLHAFSLKVPDINGTSMEATAPLPPTFAGILTEAGIAIPEL